MLVYNMCSPNNLSRLVGFANRSFKSLRFPGESFDSSSPSSLTYGIHAFHCPDPIVQETQNPEVADSPTPDGKHVRLAEALNSCNSTEDDVANVLEDLGDRIVEQDAVVVLNNMVNPKNALLALKFFQSKLKPKREVILYNVTLKVFRKCKDLDRAEKLFDEMLERGVKPDNITFSTMISYARMSSFPDQAVEWFEKMPTFGCDPDDVTYSAMIDAYGRAGNVDMAFSLYDCARIEKWRIDPVTFSTLIKIHGQSGNFDGCLNVYEEMKAIGARTNLVIYNTLLDAMGRAKRPWQAKKIYKEMTENGFSPKLDAKIEIVLGKSKKFDSIMTAAVASELATKDKENLFHQSKFCFFVAYENGPRRTYSVHNEKTAQSDELPTNLRLSVERD
ncbi:hypothetical protein FEM48_Zijuj10G0000400 [Ziziphus jujuba var. spinosa]|uniref:Pentatricopeptide repeat-containing protein At4g16390, chloroplastic-like n=1 Tax=Ziziphus jujuba var. spinosa TaxID=714518 RepID=A0A978UK34_ZIZJJ|nr:hypothetical protein FEM48_Zijuj10G0000400 [Ziziphus jujuba var. spinosa]